MRLPSVWQNRSHRVTRGAYILYIVYDVTSASNSTLAERTLCVTPASLPPAPRDTTPHLAESKTATEFVRNRRSSTPLPPSFYPAPVLLDPLVSPRPYLRNLCHI